FFLRSTGALQSPADIFELHSRPVIRALQRLGLNAQFAPPNRVDVEGYKVSGMAARSTSRALLVHGTLLMNSDLNRLNALCIPPPGCPPVANLSQWIPGISPSDVMDSMVEVLKDSFDVELNKG